MLYGGVTVVDISFAIVLILLSVCGILREVMITWGDCLSDSSVKFILFLWTLFTLAVIGTLTLDVSITVLH